MFLGPFLTSTVDIYVTRRSPGVYILSRDGKTVAYVGRSDEDLSSRIKQSIGEGSYSHFWFEYLSSPKEAFDKECEYYHKYNPPENKNHPGVLPGTNWKCPIIGCPFS